MEGAVAGAGSIPQPEPTPWCTLRNSNSSWPSIEHLLVPALSTCTSLHPAASTIMMLFCRLGGVGGGWVGKPLAQDSLGSCAGAGCQERTPSSRQPRECAGTRARKKCTVRVHETTPRGPAGLAWPQPLPPHPRPGLAGGTRVWSSGSEGRPGSCLRHSLWAGHAPCQPPASSGLKARLKAAVTSTLHKFSASYFLLEWDLTYLLPPG